MCPLRLEVSDYIATITLDNPPLNLWEAGWSEQLEETVDSFGGRDDVKVAIITGAGERAFTAGRDRKNPDVMKPRAVKNYVQALMDCSVPIIGAINGYALGHGMAISASCNILIGSENASFGLPEITTGGANGGRFFRRLFPYGHTHYAVFTGERIDAQEAYRVGALFKVVPPADLMPEARKIASIIAEKSPIAVRAFKTTLRWVEDMDVQSGYELEGELHPKLYSRTKEGALHAQEARLAFAEKRKPDFTNLDSDS